MPINSKYVGNCFLLLPALLAFIFNRKMLIMLRLDVIKYILTGTIQSWDSPVQCNLTQAGLRLKTVSKIIFFHNFLKTKRARRVGTMLASCLVCLCSSEIRQSEWRKWRDMTRRLTNDPPVSWPLMSPPPPSCLLAPDVTPSLPDTMWSSRLLLTRLV